MKSYECLFTRRDLFRAVLPTALVFAGLVALLEIANWRGWLPAPPAGLDPDWTTLTHQVRSSRGRYPAGIVLTGDSTCLVGVDALGLSRQLPGHPVVLSLAMIIGLNLEVYGQAVSDFAAANPGQVRVVVLLVAPVKVTQPGLPQSEAQGQSQINLASCHARLDPEAWINGRGARLLRQRILSYVLATPLHGSGAEFYGFSSEIDAYLTAHHGSGIDSGAPLTEIPRSKRPGPALNQVPRVSPYIEQDTRAFRALIPARTKLFIGLTPGPSSMVSSAEREQRADLLRQWNLWMHADGLLINLPPALPDWMFSRTAHLNARGQEKFTVLLGHELAAALQNEKAASTNEGNLSP
jgi:hypothetical protein